MWDAEAFEESFERARRERDIRKVHQLRISVYRDTVACVRAGECQRDGQEPVSLPLSDELENRSVLYDRKIGPKPAPRRFDTRVTVLNEDCLVSARRMGGNPLVLNMANAYTPGGGVERGSGAQEEHLFRSSDYFRSLYRFHPKFATRYGLKLAEVGYPMHRQHGAIYSPKATVFRGPEEEGYPYLEAPFTVSFVAAAAIERPQLVHDEEGRWTLTPQDAQLTAEKIRTILSVAIDRGHTKLVLSAFGCGAFRNPPGHMARLFHSVLAEEAYRHSFEQIVFAIKDNGHGRQWYNPQGNYIPFASEFEKGVI